MDGVASICFDYIHSLFQILVIPASFPHYFAKARDTNRGVNNRYIVTNFSDCPANECDSNLKLDAYLNFMKGQQVYPRHIQPILIEALADTPVVCLLGSRQTGKTTLVKLIDSERPYFNFDMVGSQSIGQNVAEAVCRGGYPEPNTRSASRASRWHRQYLNAIIQRDVKDIASIRDEDEMLSLIEILSLRTASLLNISSLTKELGISKETIEKYLLKLERLFLIRRLPAWHTNQSKRLIKVRTRRARTFILFLYFGIHSEVFPKPA